MSTEVQCLADDLTRSELSAIEVEAICDTTIGFSADYGCAPERALEIFGETSVTGVEADADDESDTNAEIETAEEVSLKNGVYHEIKRKLGERFSIPPYEIAFIHEADTPAKKAALFKAVNAGRVRVLIGSTGKLGTGVNVQKRLVALHHVDEPWKPAELEQREGRILRQGNIYPEAFIFHYVTERSFDGYMLQTLESKARFISQILAGEVTARTAEDVGEMVLTVAQVKAIASGNPLVQRRIELEVKLVKLDRLRAAYYNNRAGMRADIEELPNTIAAQEAELAGHEHAKRARQPTEDDSFHIILKKKLGDAETTAFDKRERAGAHLRYLADLLIERLRRGDAGRSLTEEVGTYRGFNVSVCASGNSRFSQASTLFNFVSDIHLRAPRGATCYIAQIGESNVGITQSIDYQLRHIEDRLEQTRSGLETLRSRLQTVRAEVEKPWAHAVEYRRLKEEYEETGAKLQSEGVEVESNTTFIAEECEDGTDMAADELSEGTATQSETAIADSIGSHHNPFTGLEDWAIAVDEPLHEASGFDEDNLTGQDVNNGSFSFDFEAGGTSDIELVQHDEDDIFLTPPNSSAEDSSGETVNIDVVVSGDAQEDGDDESSCAVNVWQSQMTSSTRSDMKRKQRTPGKKSKRPSLPTAQAGFLWE